jgi:hypothetical protein
VFENGALRRIFETKRDEVTGGWKKLHNEELHNLYSALKKLVCGLHSFGKMKEGEL